MRNRVANWSCLMLNQVTFFTHALLALNAINNPLIHATNGTVIDRESAVAGFFPLMEKFIAGCAVALVASAAILGRQRERARFAEWREPAVVELLERRALVCRKALYGVDALVAVAAQNSVAKCTINGRRVSTVTARAAALLKFLLYRWPSFLRRGLLCFHHQPCLKKGRI